MMLLPYPPIHPYHTTMLQVSPIHELYLEESGNPEGLPVLFIHGGPGGGCSESDRCFFNPEVYRIILFDQRGCGRSRPHACLDDNTTPHLIEDIEKIRLHLGIDQWVLFGGSWGSTLSLAYAQSHPERVKAMILRGIFLCTPAEINWFYGPIGAANLFPDYYEQFVAPLEEQDREHRFIEAYYELLTSGDEIKRIAAAKAWSIWEGSTSTLEPNPSKIEHFSDPYTALSMARIECHYFKHDSFLKPNQLLNDIGKIAHIPSIIIHGRYDVVCTPKQAWQLHQAWPNSRLEMVRSAGHSSSEPGIADALIKATEEIAQRFQQND